MKNQLDYIEGCQLLFERYEIYLDVGQCIIKNCSDDISNPFFIGKYKSSQMFHCLETPWEVATFIKIGIEHHGE
jgi:hypothetical protein